MFPLYSLRTVPRSCVGSNFIYANLSLPRFSSFVSTAINSFFVHGSTTSPHPVPDSTHQSWNRNKPRPHHKDMLCL
uniref:Uncharacterized protein n=1 Tax=Megaselia scalaris TaxID=36166 RepID=T1GXM7_MEGSC